jgi:hypothetical protein
VVPFFRSRPRLERLLDKASRSPRHRAEFYRALLEEELWVPGALDEEGMLVQPFELDGRRVILLFTSERRLREALRTVPGALHVEGRRLLEALPPFDAIVLDHATRLQKELTPSEVRAILDGSIVELLARGATPIMLGRPKHYPVPLMDELRPILEADPGVRAAYLCQEQPEGGEPRIVIALDGDHVDDALREVEARMSAHGITGRAMRLGSDATSEYMRKETGAFVKG